MAADNGVEVRKRRRQTTERTDRILDAADQLFRERGFHAVGIDEIGAAVGISGPAIYRHFASKEEILLAAVERAVQGMVEAVTRALDEQAAPEEVMRRCVAAVAASTVDHRGLTIAYVREYRGMSPEHRQRVDEMARPAYQALRGALARVRPDLSRGDASWLIRSVNGLLNSVAQFSPAPSRAGLIRIMTTMSMGLVQHWPGTGASEAGDGPDLGAWRERRRRDERTARRELVLEAAAALFRQKGYHGVGIDEIGTATGISGPAVYRHFAGKEDILLAIFDRTREQLATGTLRATALARTAPDAIRLLVESYVDTAIVHRDGMLVYWNERHAMSEEQDARLQRELRAILDEWAAALTDAREGLSASAGRLMVSAAMALVNAAVQNLPSGWPLARAREGLVSMGVTALLAEEAREVLPAR